MTLLSLHHNQLDKSSSDRNDPNVLDGPNLDVVDLDSSPSTINSHDSKSALDISLLDDTSLFSHHYEFINHSINHIGNHPTWSFRWKTSSQKGYRRNIEKQIEDIHADLEDVVYPNFDGILTLQKRTRSTSTKRRRSTVSDILNNPTTTTTTTPIHNLNTNNDFENNNNIENLQYRIKSNNSGLIPEINEPFKIFAIADGHGGKNAADFFLYNAILGLEDILSNHPWKLNNYQDRLNLKTKFKELIKSLDDKYSKIKINEYKNWINNGGNPVGGSHSLNSLGEKRPVDDGCTFNSMIITPSAVISLNVGDSRAIIFQEKTLSKNEINDIISMEDANITSDDCIEGTGSINLGGRSQYSYASTESIARNKSDLSILSCSETYKKRFLQHQNNTIINDDNNIDNQLPVSIDCNNNVSLTINCIDNKWHSFKPIFVSKDHNMTHKEKVEKILSRGGIFVEHGGIPRNLKRRNSTDEYAKVKTSSCNTITCCDDSPCPNCIEGPYTELLGLRIYRSPNPNIKEVGVSHRRTVNMTCTLGDLLFKVEPPVMDSEPDIVFLRSCCLQNGFVLGGETESIRFDKNYNLNWNKDNCLYCGYNPKNGINLNNSNNLFNENSVFHMIIATDGIWDHVKTQTAGDMALGRLKSNELDTNLSVWEQIDATITEAYGISKNNLNELLNNNESLNQLYNDDDIENEDLLNNTNNNNNCNDDEDDYDEDIFITAIGEDFKDFVSSNNNNLSMIALAAEPNFIDNKLNEEINKEDDKEEEEEEEEEVEEEIRGRRNNNDINNKCKYCINNNFENLKLSIINNKKEEDINYNKENEIINKEKSLTTSTLSTSIPSINSGSTSLKKFNNINNINNNKFNSKSSTFKIPKHLESKQKKLSIGRKILNPLNHQHNNIINPAKKLSHREGDGFWQNMLRYDDATAIVIHIERSLA